VPPLPNDPEPAVPPAPGFLPAGPEPVVTSWVIPGAPPAASRWGNWTPPPDERTITVGGVIGEAWTTYRRAFGPLLAMGTVIGLLLILLSLPSEVYTVRTYDALIRVIVDAVNTRANHTGISDPILLQDQIVALATIPTGTAVIFAITGGLATGVGILGSCVLTSAALAARAGRRVSPTEALTAVLARSSALVVPALLLAAGSTLVTLTIQLNSDTIQRSDLTSAGGTSTSEIALTIAAFVIVVAIFYLSVRWGLAIAAILREDLSLRAGLRRSSELTHRHRLRLGAIFILVGLLQALTVSLPAIAVGAGVGVQLGSVSSGIVAFTLAAVVGSALWAPFNPAVAAVIYGRLTEREGGPTAAPGSSGVAGAGEVSPTD
jgi:hypothetical protein